MADIKDTVASHITSNWNAAVVGGSGSVPTADAVGPEDITKPEDYPEAILVYNETVGWDRLYNQATLGDRHTRVYMLLTAHTKSGCTKTHFRAFIDELKSVFGSAISGFDLQILDPEQNVTRTKGVSGDGMYQASFVLHLYEYGVSTSSAAAGGAAGASYWAEYFVTTQASANLTNETVLSTKMGAHDFDIIPSADSSYDLGDATHYYALAYIDAITTTGNVTIGGDLTVTGDVDITGDVTEVDEIKSAGTIEIKPSGETDDYITIFASGNAPYIKAIGNGDLNLTTDGGTINLMSSNDTDDYLEISTVAGTPRITIQGGSDMRIATSDTSWAGFRVWETDSKYIFMRWSKTSDYGTIWCTHDIRMIADGDTTDYLYFSTAANIAALLPVEDKVHVLGDAALSFDHVYSDDFDNTSPFELIENPLESLKAIAAKKVMDPKQGEIDALDYRTLPDFVRTHTRDSSKDVIEKYTDEDGNEQEKVLERAPKDVIADEGFSINRMCILLYQAVQELTAKVETLEAQIAQEAPKT